MNEIRCKCGIPVAESADAFPMTLFAGMTLTCICGNVVFQWWPVVPQPVFAESPRSSREVN